MKTKPKNKDKRRRRYRCPFCKADTGITSERRLQGERDGFDLTLCQRCTIPLQITPSGGFIYVVELPELYAKIPDKLMALDRYNHERSDLLAKNKPSMTKLPEDIRKFNVAEDPMLTRIAEYAEKGYFDDYKFPDLYDRDPVFHAWLYAHGLSDPPGPKYLLVQLLDKVEGWGWLAENVKGGLYDDRADFKDIEEMRNDLDGQDLGNLKNMLGL